jgi:4-hydroxybenzoate polyprenyltransferase
MADDKPPRKRAPRKTAAAEGAGTAPARSRAAKSAAPAKVSRAPTADGGPARAKAKAKAAEPARKRATKAAPVKPAAAAAAVPPPVPAKPPAPPARATAPAASARERTPRARKSAPPAVPMRSQAVRSASPRPRTGRPVAADRGGWRGALAGLERLLERADPYLRLCRLDRPIGYLLLLWPTWWGLWAAAGGTPPLSLLLIFTLGVVLMRSAGCVINDYADRWLDPQVQRTRNRPLAAGEVGPKSALLLFAALLLAAFVLVLFTNGLTVRLALVGAVLAASYPFLKRYTHLPQIYLGVAFGWAIPMAFAAVLGEVPRLAWLLFIATIAWATAYDTLYAMVDRDDDIKAGARSTAILFGDMDLVAVAMLHATFLMAMLFAGQQLDLGTPWLLALALAAGLCALQLWRARGRDRAGCFRAFLDNHWVGLVLFLGLAIGLAGRP